MGIRRKTEAATLLLEEFKKDSNAISAIELIKRLDQKINKTTVYRLLDKLEDDGVIHYFLDMKGIKWYATCSDCSKTQHQDVHPHFQCTECGTVDCLEIKVPIPNIPNRTIASSQILVVGTCELCLNLR